MKRFRGDQGEEALQEVVRWDADASTKKPLQAVVRVYCDGACSNNQDRTLAKAGVGVYFAADCPLNVSEKLQGELQTNQRAELTAAIRAMEQDTEHDLIIVTDSDYTCKGVDSWMAGWKRKGWKNAAGKPVANQDLWKEIDRLLQQPHRKVRFEWTKGHAGDPGNEAADKLAKQGIGL